MVGRLGRTVDPGARVRVSTASSLPKGSREHHPVCGLRDLLHFSQMVAFDSYRRDFGSELGGTLYWLKTSSFS